MMFRTLYDMFCIVKMRGQVPLVKTIVTLVLLVAVSALIIYVAAYILEIDINIPFF